MPTINQLSRIIELGDGDLLPVQSTNSGDARAISAYDLANYINGKNQQSSNSITTSSQTSNVKIGDDLHTLINYGLVANSEFDNLGRGDYFPYQSGTSEGQIWLTWGVSEAFLATNDVNWQILLTKLIEGTSKLYGNNSILHWLFNVKGSFISENVNYTTIINFTNGIGTIPKSLDGDIARVVYQVCSSDAVLIWENPYSGLKSGSKYTINYYYKTLDGKTNIVLTNTFFTGSALVIYSTVNGEIINRGDLFEAWPNWRHLTQGEKDVAMDTLIWSIYMFDSLFESTLDVSWQNKKTDLLNKSFDLYNVNDGRAWFTKRVVHPLQVSGTYMFSDVSGLIIGLDEDGSTLFEMQTIPNPVGSSEVQLGRSITDIFTSGDYISIIINVDHSITMSFFIDTSAVYSPAIRFSYSANLTIGLNTLTLPISSFVNNSLTPLTIGVNLYNCGFSIVNTNNPNVSPFKINIYEFRPYPETSLNYIPGVCPFTANYLAGDVVSWRGPIYSGYQNPEIWSTIQGHENKSSVVLQYLLDAQAAYASHIGISGPFAPVYVLDRYDSEDFGTPNTFSWSGPDPNTIWEGYQYRPLFFTAKYLYENPNSTNAKTIVGNFINYLNLNFNSNTGVPSSFPSDANPKYDYFVAHGNFLVLGACIYLELSGNGSLNSSQLITKIKDVLIREFENGIWGKSGWFGFWNGVVLVVLSLIVKHNLNIFSQTQLEQFFNENLNHLLQVTKN